MEPEQFVFACAQNESTCAQRVQQQLWHCHLELGKCWTVRTWYGKVFDRHLYSGIYKRHAWHWRPWFFGVSNPCARQVATCEAASGNVGVVSLPLLAVEPQSLVTILWGREKVTEILWIVVQVHIIIILVYNYIIVYIYDILTSSIRYLLYISGACTQSHSFHHKTPKKETLEPDRVW